MRVIRAVLAFALLALSMLPASAQVKVGLLVSLTGPQSGIGIQARDGFNLAMKQLGGRLGGFEARAIVEDDTQQKEIALAKAKSLIEREKIDVLIGPLFSDLLGAVSKPVSDAGVVLISPRAGPAALAGRSCDQNFFVMSNQTEQLVETLGRHAEDAGLKRLVLVAMADATGRTSIESFKRHYLGETLADVLVTSDDADPEKLWAKASALQPHIVVSLLAGQPGRDFMLHWGKTAALNEAIPLYSLVLFDNVAPASEAPAAVLGAGIWTPGLETPENATFVASFEAEYGYPPGNAAFEAFDAAMLLDSAVGKVKGNLTDKAALRAAMKLADFKSLRGGFSFGNNNFPVQDFYLLKVAKRLDGRGEPQILKRIFSTYGDAYASECPLK